MFTGRVPSFAIVETPVGLGLLNFEKMGLDSDIGSFVVESDEFVFMEGLRQSLNLPIRKLF